MAAEVEAKLLVVVGILEGERDIVVNVQQSHTYRTRVSITAWTLVGR